MNKKELLENYTMEQLADMVIEKDKYLEELGNQLTDKHEFEELIKNEYVSVINAKQGEIENLKSALCRKEITINQIDDILNEIFGVTHDIAKPDKFKEILKEKIENSKTIADFLPAEPIKVADMLIESFHEPSKAPLLGFEEMFKQENKMLRQIAEHLLIYCNANGDREEC